MIQAFHRLRISQNERNIKALRKPNTKAKKMNSFGKMNILLTILVVFEPRRFRKNFYGLFC